MRVHAVIVAAGLGKRASTPRPKQFTNLAGKPLFQWSIDAFSQHPSIDSICLVVPASHSGGTAIRPTGVITTPGGRTRAISVQNGLTALDADDGDIVLIHDAARPGLTQETITALLAALETSDASAPALPVADALKRQNETRLQTVERQGLHRVQTPQAFRYGTIRTALHQADADLVDDLAAVEAIGASVQLVPGDHRLDKITFEDDFSRMERLLSDRIPAVRVGTGYDVHSFAPGDAVTLCGVTVPHDRTLSGHSDADVGWHALTDAILGAAALGDIGDHFPPTDAKWKGASSEIFLQHALDLAEQAGWSLCNCDLTLICEAPKIKPHRQAMRERTAQIARVSIDSVSIKATTTEGLGFAGRKEGIAAQAVATLSRSIRQET